MQTSPKLQQSTTAGASNHSPSHENSAKKKSKSKKGGKQYASVGLQTDVSLVHCIRSLTWVPVTNEMNPRVDKPPGLDSANDDESDDGDGDPDDDGSH